MSHQEIRKRFLDFFEKNGHKIVPSFSLIPSDPSVLFTTAGMQQFKPYYTNSELAPAKNITSIQKCLRTSDIDKVGDENHLTFFEMLGNFSFGGYGKKEAIKYAHEFITKELSLKIDYVTVFEGWRSIGLNIIRPDNESEKIWKSIDSNIRIKKRGFEDNFWGPTGEEGPCGPTTEIYVDGMEIWNIVFNEYYGIENPSWFSLVNLLRMMEGRGHRNLNLKKLQTAGIDTGIGFERLAMVAQKKNNIFETDLFIKPFSPLLASLGGVDIRSNRIVADHLRASVFLLADGVEPSNKERGYILRRLIRRLMVHAKRLFIPIKTLESFIDNLINEYSIFYPELQSHRLQVLNNFIKEIEIFNKTLEKGLKEFDKRFPGIVAQRIISGQEIKPFIVGQKVGREAFDFYQTYGFPIELIKELLEEKLYTFDLEGFNEGFKQAIDEEFKKHQGKSRAGLEKKFKR